MVSDGILTGNRFIRIGFIMVAVENGWLDGGQWWLAMVVVVIMINSG